MTKSKDQPKKTVSPAKGELPEQALEQASGGAAVATNADIYGGGGGSGFGGGGGAGFAGDGSVKTNNTLIGLLRKG